MPETGDKKEIASQKKPSYIGAVFENGGSHVLVHDRWTGKDLAPVYNVEKENDRKRWTFDNLRVFSDGSVPVPEQRWLEIIHAWKEDLDTARSVTAREIKNSVERRTFEKETAKTEKWLKAAMAVSVAARAMEGSQGVANAYIGSLTGNPEVTNTSFSNEFFLAGDAQKYLDVLNDPLVNHYYKKIIEDAKINLDSKDEWHEETKEEVEDEGEKTYKKEWKQSKLDNSNIKISDFNFKGKESGSKLVDYLRTKNKYNPDFKYKEGFDAYIAEVLLADPTVDGEEAEALTKSVAVGAENADSIRWTAAKLACDLFLVDKYTRWEYIITNASDTDPKKRNDLGLRPVPRWQGDPLRALLQPSFTPRIIKKVYGEAPAEDQMTILDLVDIAFNPTDVFTGKRAEKSLPVSMVGNLSNYGRYNEALSKFLGGTMATAIPDWSDQSIGNLELIGDNLTQIYGGIEGEKGTDEPKEIGRHIVAVMLARILEAKALAAASLTHRAGLRESIQFILGPDEKSARPFYDVEVKLFGPDLGRHGKYEGLIGKLASGRIRIGFGKNYFKAEESIVEVQKILATNDQDPQGRNKAQYLELFRAAAKIAKIGAKYSGVK